MNKLYCYISIFFLFSCISSSSENSSTINTSPKDTTTLEKGSNNISIKGSISGGNNMNYFLYYIGDPKPYVLDSCKITNEQLSFDTPLPYEHNLLGVGNSPKNLMLLIGKRNDQIIIKANQSDLPVNYTVSGSNASKSIQAYNKTKVELINKYNLFQKELMSLNNKLKQQEIQDEIEKITGEFNILKNQFIEDNKGTPAVIMAFQDITDYLNEVPQLKIIEKSINEYFPNTIFKQNIETILNQIAQQKTQIDQQKNKLSNAGISIGKQAPELNFPDINGNKIALSSLKGKIVLLDFWASWCGPCRKENPFVVNLYNKYKNKGFEIYSFSLDNQKDKWINAIKLDGLIWENHVSDLKGWQSLGASKYMIRSIPQTFLLDKNGIIIDIGLRGTQLETRLKELLET